MCCGLVGVRGIKVRSNGGGADEDVHPTHRGWFGVKLRGWSYGTKWQKAVPLTGVRGSEGRFGGPKVSCGGSKSGFWGLAEWGWRCADGVVPDAGAF